MHVKLQKQNAMCINEDTYCEINLDGGSKNETWCTTMSSMIKFCSFVTYVVIIKIILGFYIQFCLNIFPIMTSYADICRIKRRWSLHGHSIFIKVEMHLF